MKRNFIVAHLLVIACVPLPACAGSLTYVAETMQARIIDADTKQPIEGVVIVAHWELEHGTVGGNVPSGQLKVMEAVTNTDGKFSFPGFGPETVWNSFLVDKDPELIIFKSGYKYQRLSNEYSSDRELRTKSVRRSDWDGKTIVLVPFKGTTEEYAKHLGFMTSSLESILSEPCGWKNIPQAISAINEQSQIFRARGLYSLPSIESLDARYSNFKTKCGSVKDFFGSYRP